MKSRAVPEGFDRSSTLYSAFPTPYQPDISSTMQPSYGSPENIRENTGAPGFGHTRDISGETSSSNVLSAYSEPFWILDSVLGSEIHLSVPPIDERTNFMSSVASYLPTPNHCTLYAQPQSSPATYTTSPHSRSRTQAESLASPPSAAFTGTGHTRHGSSQARGVSARPASPAFMHHPRQPQTESPFHGMVGYSPPDRHTPRTKSRSGIAPESLFQQAHPTANESSDYFG